MDSKQIKSILDIDNFYATDFVEFYVLNDKYKNIDECKLIFAGSDVYKFSYDTIVDNKVYFKLTEDITKEINKGVYKVFILYSSTTDKFKKTEEIKNIEVFQNIEDITSFEYVQSYNKRMLTAITDLLEGRVKDDYINYTIGNRSITKMSIESLISLKDRFQEAVDNEENIKNGRNRGTKIKIRWMGR